MLKPENIDALVFDLGGVVMNLDFVRSRQAFADLGLPEFYKADPNETFYKVTMDFLNGLTTDEEFYRAIKPYCREGITLGEILSRMNDALDEIPLSRLQRLAAWRKHYKVYLLSNLNEMAWIASLQMFRDKGFEPEDCFDKLFLSFEMKLAKPDARIYRQLIDETGINPSRTLYFDDLAENIEGGKACGLQSYRVTPNNIELLWEELGL
ncbi:MAG: HAD family phosphatase [Bacteroidales bacterium]|nr:HAD family phosphatase [Bacteroidales bacterium]